MGIIKRCYRLVDYKTNLRGEQVNLLTQNRDKAVEYYRNGGTVEVGYVQEYSRGRQYPWGKWERHIPAGGRK